MNELEARAEREQSALDGLATQARTFAQGAAMNLLQLGRVLTEAKPLVPRGAWSEWVRLNAKMGMRTAEQYMQAYQEFGLDARIAELGTSKVIKLLPMDEAEREKLLAEKNVAAMSARQLDEAIKEQRERLLEEARAAARAEVQADLLSERKARLEAEHLASELAARPPEIPEEVQTELEESREALRQSQENARHFAELARDMGNEKTRLQKENRSLQAEIGEQGELLRETQAECSRAQAELLNMQSQIARGDAERVPSDELTAEVFAAAVRQFIGICARMPHMRRTFAAMAGEQIAEYDELLRVMEDWTEGARNALNTMEATLV